MINMSDFMGIKKSDSIDNFYKIKDVLGRGKSFIKSICKSCFEMKSQNQFETHVLKGCTLSIFKL